MQIRVITGIENNILHIVKNEESAPFRGFFFFFFFFQINRKALKILGSLLQGVKVYKGYLNLNLAKGQQPPCLG